MSGYSKEISDVRDRSHPLHQPRADRPLMAAGQTANDRDRAEGVQVYCHNDVVGELRASRAVSLAFPAHPTLCLDPPVNVEDRLSTAQICPAIGKIQTQRSRKYSVTSVWPSPSPNLTPTPLHHCTQSSLFSLSSSSAHAMTLPICSFSLTSCLS